MSAVDSILLPLAELPTKPFACCMSPPYGVIQRRLPFLLRNPTLSGGKSPTEFFQLKPTNSSLSKRSPGTLCFGVLTRSSRDSPSTIKIERSEQAARRRSALCKELMPTARRCHHPLPLLRCFRHLTASSSPCDAICARNRSSGPGGRRPSTHLALLAWHALHETRLAFSRHPTAEFRQRYNGAAL